MKEFIKNIYKKFIKRNIEMGQAFKDEVEPADPENLTEDKYKKLTQNVNKRAEVIEGANLAEAKRVQEIIETAKAKIEGLKLKQKLEELLAWVNSEVDKLESVNTQFIIDRISKLDLDGSFPGYKEKYYLIEQFTSKPDTKLKNALSITVEFTSYESKSKVYVMNMSDLYESWDDINLDEVFKCLEDYFVETIARIKVKEKNSN